MNYWRVWRIFWRDNVSSFALHLCSHSIIYEGTLIKIFFLIIFNFAWSVFNFKYYFSYYNFVTDFCIFYFQLHLKNYIIIIVMIIINYNCSW